MAKRLTRAAAIAFMVIAARGAAQDTPPADGTASRGFAKDSPYRLILDLLSGSVELRDQKGRVVERFASTRDMPLASVPASRSLSVELVNANPLLYRYEVSASSAARGGGKSCIGIGDRFSATGVFASMIAMPGQAPGTVVPGRELFVPPPPPPPGVRGDGNSAFTPEFITAAADQLRQPVAQYVASLSRLRTLPAAVEDSIAVAAELGESLPLDTLLAGLQRSVEGLLPGVTSAAGVQPYVRQRVSQSAAANEALGYAAAIRSGAYQGDSSDAAAAEILAFASSINAAQRETIPFARQLQNHLRRIELARENSRQTFTFDATSDFRRIIVQSTPTQEFPDVLRLRAGRREVFSRPVSSLLCEVSVGMAFMDAPPRYAVDDGILVDRDASAERTAPHFMAHVAWTRIPWVAALGGMGFGGQARPDFYLGGSFRALSPILLNIGAIWQRTDALPGNLAVGGGVTDPNALADLPRRYRAGFFWGFSFGR